MIKNNLSVYAIKYAESALPESMVFKGGRNDKNIPISFAVYLIQTENKTILVDAGCDTMPDFKMKCFYSPAFVLRTVGLSADDITDVIITHAHHDHIEAVKYFKNATVHINNEEYLIGKDSISKKNTVNTFEKELNITDNIKIVNVGGHTKGSSIVEIDLGNVIYVLCGDECYTSSNIDKKIPTGSSYSPEKSLQFIKKYSNKKYRVHTCHDISLKTERII